MKVKTILGVVAFILLGIFVIQNQDTKAGYRYQPQKTLATTITAAADATTDCDAQTDLDALTDTAFLTCLNTGDLDSQQWNQATVSIEYTRGSGAAGTHIYMQCDRKEDPSFSTNWYAITDVDADNNSIVRFWKHAVVGSTRITWNFPVNAYRLRCRFWVLAGNTNDQIGPVYFRKASDVPDKK